MDCQIPEPAAEGPSCCRQRQDGIPQRPGAHDRQMALSLVILPNRRSGLYFSEVPFPESNLEADTPGAARGSDFNPSMQAG